MLEEIIALLARAPLHAMIDVLPVAAPRWPRIRQAAASRARSGRRCRPRRTSPTRGDCWRLSRSACGVVTSISRSSTAPISCGCCRISHPTCPASWSPTTSSISSIAPRSRRSDPPQLAQRLFAPDLRTLAAYELRGLRDGARVVPVARRRRLRRARVSRPPHARDPAPLRLPAPPPPVRARTSPGLDLGILANFTWWLNREGLRWFLAEVFPQTGDDVRLHLFGTGSASAAPPHPRIVPHGFVTRRADIWPLCDLMLCPNFSGGGVSVKFAEALYNGMQVLARPFAARGLALPPDPTIVLRDDAGESVSFLGSTAARERRSGSPSDVLARTFAIESHREAVHAFVRAADR